MTYPTVTPLPPAPQRTQAPDAFSLTADAFVASLPGLVSDVNAAGVYFDERVTSVGNSFKGVYAAGTTYAQGDSTLYNEKYYLSLVNSNTGNTPTSSPTQWTEIAGAPLPKEGTQEFIAKGTIPSGAVVGLNTDGTVSVVNAPFTNVTAFPQSFVSLNILACYLKSSNKVVVAYFTASELSLVVGTISNKVITFGARVQIGANSTPFDSLAASETSETIVFSYWETAVNAFRLRAATISGTTITLGTTLATNIKEGSVPGNKIKYNPVTNSFVVVSTATTAILNIRAFTISGTTITLSAATTLSTLTNSGFDLVYDTTNSNFAFIYQQVTTGFPTINTLTATGTTITLGATPVVFLTTNITPGSVFYDSITNKVIIWEATRVYVGRNVSGVFVVGSAILKSSFTDLTESFVAFVEGQGGLLLVGDSPPPSWNVEQRQALYVIITPNEDNTVTCSAKKQLLEFSLLTGTDQVLPLTGSQIFLGTTYSSTTSMLLFDVNHLYDSFIGVADYAVTNAQTVRVVVAGGINTGMTGLTRGDQYYLQNNGQLSKEFKRNRRIGVALSTTSLLVYGGSIEL